MAITIGNAEGGDQGKEGVKNDTCRWMDNNTKEEIDESEVEPFLETQAKRVEVNLQVLSFWKRAQIFILKMSLVIRIRRTRIIFIFIIILPQNIPFYCLFIQVKWKFYILSWNN